MLANWAKHKQCRTMGCTNQSMLDGGDMRYCSDCASPFTKHAQNDWEQSGLYSNHINVPSVEHNMKVK